MAKSLTGQLDHVPDLAAARLRSRHEPAGQLSLQRDQGKTVAEQIMKVPGDARSLLLDRQPGHLLAGGSQFREHVEQVSQAHRAQPPQQYLGQKEEHLDRCLSGGKPDSDQGV
jgi:hypothetical protein